MSDLQYEIAAPGSVFWETVLHPANVEIVEGDAAKSRKLSPQKLKEIRVKIEAVQSALNVYWRAYLRHLDQRERSIARGMDEEQRRDLILTIEDRRERARARILPARRAAARRIRIRNPHQVKQAQSVVHRLRARLKEHQSALEFEATNARLRREMQDEIAFYGQQIIDRWSALGYREEYTKEGKRYLRRVQFSEARFTEDTIQFKIFVSSLSILGSTRHQLPQGVRAWDLVKADTLRELESACECPVTSPHVEENYGMDHGAWIVVHRVGMRDGLFNYIDLGKVLAKYNQALRPKFAAPVGIKSGRQVEYLRLADTPHLMFNGITGSGKTNIARVMLATWAQFYSPDEIRFVLIDLKRSGDLNHFDRVPHLLHEIMKTTEEMAKFMPRLVALMHDRMATLSAARAFDIGEYNAAHPANERMARVVVMIDECQSISDLAENKNEKEVIWRCMKLIAAQARAAGIHLMLGTQQPSTKVIPASITNNVTHTLAGRQRTVSGAMMSGGDNATRHLPAIRGRMLYDSGDTIIQVQTPHATDADLARAVAVAMDYPAPAPFAWPDETTLQDATDMTPLALAAEGVTPARIIAHAIAEGNGVMSARKVYEAAQGVTARASIEAMIAELATRGEVQHDGRTFDVRKAGKGWRLAERKPENPTINVSDSGIQHDGDTGLQVENHEVEAA